MFNAFSSIVRIFLIALVLIVSGVQTGNALVDMKNANYSDTWTDVSEKLGVTILRTYNSRSLFDGMFGFGWCSDFETSVSLNDRGAYELSFCGDGLRLEFAPQQLGEGPGRVQATKDGDTLEISDQSFLYRRNDGKETLHFDRMGKLSAIETSGFGTVRIMRQYGRITAIADWEGRLYRFSTSSTGKVFHILTPDDLLIEYQYNQNGDLVAVKNAWKNVYTFSYDDLHNLVRATWPDRTFIEIEYNRENDWVASFVDRDRCKEAYKYDLSKRKDEVYWASMTKRCNEKLITEGLYEFVYTEDSPLKPGRLWKTRISIGLPEPGGVKFTETVYPEFGEPIVTNETRDSLHSPLLMQQ